MGRVRLTQGSAAALLLAVLVTSGAVLPFLAIPGAATAAPDRESPLAATIDARIVDFDVAPGTYTPGDEVDATATVENTGDTEHTFFVGYSVEGPNGEYYDNGGTTGRRVTLDPGERVDVRLSWTVEDDAPSGDYGAITSVWKESDRDNLQTRLDSEERSNAFEVEAEQIDARITDFDVDSGTYRVGDEVDATAVVENTGNTEHTFFVGYSVYGPNGGTYDNNDQTGTRVRLAPGERTSVELSWSVEDDAPGGSYDAETAVWKESDRDNLHTRLDSQEDRGAFEVEKTEIDARITDFDVASGTYRPGEEVEATATVKNTGNTEHTFFVGYSVHGPNGGTYDNNDQTGTRVRLAAGERTSVGLSWTVEDDAPGGSYDAETAVWKESDRDNLQTRLDGQRQRNAFEVEKEDVDARITDFDVAGGTYRPGEVVEATATVENTGNTEHTFFVGYSVYGPNGGTYDNNDQTGTRVRLAAGERTDVQLSWTVQDDAPSGSYDAETAVWKESDRDNLRTRLDNSRQADAFEVQKEEVNARIVDFEVSSGTYRSGDVVTATAIVENTGNTEHTFFVGYSVYGPNGGTYDNSDRTGTRVRLAPGERTSVDLSWTVENDAPSGSYDAETAIWKESDRDNLHTRLDNERQSNAFNIETKEVDARITNFRVESGTYGVGEGVTATATVENTGNTEHTFFVGYSVYGPDGGTYDNNDQTGTRVQLAAGERTDVQLSWTVQDGVPTGSYDAETAVWKESDRDNLHTRLDSQKQRNTFDVKKRTIEAQILSFEVESGTYNAGDQVKATATVKNTGNTEHTFFVGYSVYDSDGQAHDNDGETGTSIRLAPDEQREVSLSWTVQQGSPSGSYDAKTVIWKESDRDELRHRLDEQRKRSVFEIEQKSINAQVVEFTVDDGTYRPGDSVSATATIKNTGNTRHTFFVGYSVIGPSGDSYDNNGETGQRLTLGAGERTEIDLSWSVPETAGSGEYAAVTAVWQESNPENLTTRLDRQRTSNAFKIVTQTAVTLQVQGPDDQPVTGATVSIEGGPSKETGTNGTVQFDELASGTYAVTISREGFITEELEVTVTEGQRQLREVRLARPGGSIVTVEGVPEAYQPGQKFTPIITIRNTGTSEATFVLQMSEPSGIEIDGSQTRTVTLAPGSETTLEFNAQFYGTDTDRVVRFELSTTDGHAVDSVRESVTYTETVLTVNVVDTTGDPVEGASVSLLSEQKAVETDREGQVRFTAFTPGEHVVKVTPPAVVGGGKTKTVDVAAGERTETTVQIERTGTLSGTVVNEDGEPLTDAVVSINGESSTVGTNGEFSFDDSRFAAGKSYTIDVSREGESLYRQGISISPGNNDVQITVDTSESSGGWQLVSNANKGALLGEVGIQMGVPGSRTLEYHVGWLGFSMVPVADAPADIRDCILAPNDGLATNGLDCGGAAASTVGSAGTIVGVVTSPSGAGVAIAGGSFALDTAEDVSDAVRVSVSLVRNVPSKVDEWAEILVSKVGDRVSAVVDEIKNTDVANKLSKSVNIRRIQSKTGLNKQQATNIIEKSDQPARQVSEKAIELTDRGVAEETLVRIADRGGDVGQTRMATRVDDEVIWLEKGTESSGWEHISRTKRINDFRRSSSLNVETSSDVQRLIFDTVEKAANKDNVYKIPEENGGGKAYVAKMRDGKRVTVIVGENGYIVTSYPGRPQNVKINS